MTKGTADKTILLVGATGHLGGLIASEAHRAGYRVRYLLREGAVPSGPGVDGREAFRGEVVRGDMRDLASLTRAMTGCHGVISSAAGYTGRRPGDRRSDTDTRGNENLAEAARVTGIRRYVFCSVLTCDRAREVPHFWNKKRAEDALEAAGVPFVALRPGAFIEQGPQDFWAKGLRRDRLNFLVDPAIRLTFVHPAEVARCLVAALAVETDDRALRVDIGSDRAVSVAEVARIMSDITGRTIRAAVPPWWVVNAAFRTIGLFNPAMDDLRRMMKYIRRGGYIADTSLQARYFGPPPRIEEGIETYLRDRGLL